MTKTNCSTSLHHRIFTCKISILPVYIPLFEFKESRKHPSLNTVPNSVTCHLKQIQGSSMNSKARLLCYHFCFFLFFFRNRISIQICIFYVKLNLNLPLLFLRLISTLYIWRLELFFHPSKNSFILIKIV